MQRLQLLAVAVEPDTLVRAVARVTSLVDCWFSSAQQKGVVSVSSIFPPSENRLLAALPDDVYQRLLPDLKVVSLSLHQSLYEAGEPIEYLYFPHKSVVSLVSTMQDGATIEISLVGREGMVGMPAILNSVSRTHHAFVQLADGATRIRTEMLKQEFDRGGALQNLLLRYVFASFTQAAQVAACNRFHRVEERLARWLLSVSDCVGAENFLLTQEFIADMLGTRRSGVTVAAGILQQAGIIRYTRGKINILDRLALESTACECYQVIKDEYELLYK